MENHSPAGVIQLHVEPLVGIFAVLLFGIAFDLIRCF